ncbi:hypothetical protein C2845_PM14G20890 [Panicum miliaceum]|uniref:Uncharacterized protein n=1 Tax=Panicum miliaceum TaxID=4540 RepID=A0A3L6PMV5_PANMI|nr:hypothetical protein C2845_PM14G20890 [Panicum miliaceum]
MGRMIVPKIFSSTVVIEILNSLHKAILVSSTYMSPREIGDRRATMCRSSIENLAEVSNAAFLREL